MVVAGDDVALVVEAGILSAGEVSGAAESDNFGSPIGTPPRVFAVNSLSDWRQPTAEKTDGEGEPGNVGSRRRRPPTTAPAMGAKPYS